MCGIQATGDSGKSGFQLPGFGTRRHPMGTGGGIEMMSNVNRESPISCAAAMERHGDGGHGEPLVYRHSS